MAELPDKVWEDMITLKSAVDDEFVPLGQPRDYRPEIIPKGDFGVPIDTALDADHYCLPDTKDREGYHGQKHFEYWLSGLTARKRLLDYAIAAGTDVRAYLDMGCASGRVIRHFGALDPDIDVYGCDINRRHIEFCARFLPRRMTVFQTHSIPNIPLPDRSIDLITAFSVFTHIEAMETTWLMELRRILRPGGIAWITVHSEKKIFSAPDDYWAFGSIRKHKQFPELKAAGGLQTDRAVFRWRSDASYSSNTVYKREYMMDRWSRIMPVREYIEDTGIQDVIVFQV